MCVRGGGERDREMGHRKEEKKKGIVEIRAVWRENRGIPIRETDEGTAEDDSNI